MDDIFRRDKEEKCGLGGGAVPMGAKLIQFALAKVVSRRSAGGTRIAPVRKRYLHSFMAGRVGFLIFLISFSGKGWGQEEVSPVVVSPVIQREVTARETFIGTVVPARRTVVGSGVDGRILHFLVNEGDPVRKDQPVARLSTITLEIELAAARAHLELRRQALAELEHGSLSLEIEQAKARLLDTKAVMEYSNAQYKRMKALFESGTVSQQELDATTSAWLAAEQNHLGAQAAYDLAVEGPRPERIAQARALVRAQEEEIRRLQDLLWKHNLRAPFDGYVVKKYTEVGAWIRKGDPLVEVVELDPVEIDISVPDSLIAYLEVGAVQPVEVEALPARILQELDKPLQGKLVRIVPQADLRSRTFPVKLRLRNPRHGNSHLLKAGMLARVLLAVGEPRLSLLVPKNALVLGGRTSIVFVVQTDPESKQATASPVEVQIGVAEGSWIQVTGLLQEGEQVVVEGNERLRPGAAVRVLRVEPANGTETRNPKLPHKEPSRGFPIGSR